jgi:hypothetical protein
MVSIYRAFARVIVIVIVIVIVKVKYSNLLLCFLVVSSSIC